MDPNAHPDAAGRLAHLRTAYADVRPKVVGAGPWPLAADFGTGPEASWGPPEVLAHLAEMLPYWYGQYGRVVEGAGAAGRAVPFGRTADDPVRAAVLERDRQFPLGDLFDLVDDGIARWERRASADTAAQAACVGLHPKLGEMAASEIRDRFVVAHLEEHLRQLEASLAAG